MGVWLDTKLRTPINYLKRLTLVKLFMKTILIFKIALLILITACPTTSSLSLNHISILLFIL